MASGYIIATSVAAVIAAAVLIASPIRPISLLGFALIMALGAAAHAYPIRGYRHQAYQITLPFIVLAAAMFNGIELVAFILLIHAAEQARLRRPLYIQWFNTCNYFLSAALAVTFYHHAIAMLPVGAVGELTAALAAACSFIVVNRLLLVIALWLARGLSPVASGLFQPELLAADLVIAWIAGPMLVLAIEAGPWTVLVTAGPLLLARPALAALLGRQPNSSERLQVPAA
jgi:hypothetical protein